MNYALIRKGISILKYKYLFLKCFEKNLTFIFELLFIEYIFKLFKKLTGNIE